MLLLTNLFGVFDGINSFMGGTFLPMQTKMHSYNGHRPGKYTRVKNEITNEKISKVLGFGQEAKETRQKNDDRSGKDAADGVRKNKNTKNDDPSTAVEPSVKAAEECSMKAIDVIDVPEVVFFNFFVILFYCFLVYFWFLILFLFRFYFFSYII